MMASLFLSRVLGIIRDIITAALFGQNAHTDAYRISYQIPDLLFFLVAGGALSSAFIPVFSEYLSNDNEEDAWKVYSTVLCVMSLALIVLIGGAWFLAPQISAIVCGAKTDLIGDVTLMSRIVLPAQFAFFIGGLMMGTLYARGIFTVPGLGPNIYNIGIIAGAIFLGNVVSPGVSGMSWGALVGAILGNIVVPLFAMRRIGVKFKPALDFDHPGVKKVFRLMLPVILGLSLPGVYALILQYFCTFYDKGSNTATDTANRLMQAPLAVFGQSLALAAFPALSQFWAQDKREAFGSQVTKTVQTVLYLTLPISAMLVAMPWQIVRVLFQHGNFMAIDTYRTAPILQTFAFGVVAWCLHPVLMRAYFAMQSNVRPIVMGTIATALFLGIGVAILAFKAPIATFGIAGTVSATVLVIAMVIDLRKAVPSVAANEILSTALKAGFASIVIAVGCGVSVKWVENTLKSLPIGKPGFAIGLVVFGLCWLWVYFYITRALKMNETNYLTRALSRKKS